MICLLPETVLLLQKGPCLLFVFNGLMSLFLVISAVPAYSRPHQRCSSAVSSSDPLHQVCVYVCVCVCVCVCLCVTRTCAPERRPALGMIFFLSFIGVTRCFGDQCSPRLLCNSVVVHTGVMVLVSFTKCVSVCT